MTDASSAPEFLPPDWRYAGDDWVGANALSFTAWVTEPVYASDGVTVVTAGVPRDLTGCTVTGLLRWQSRCAGPAPSAPTLPDPTGAISSTPTNGILTLSLTKTQTIIFIPQRYADWADPSRALLLVQPKVVDADNNAVSVGLRPLFVF